MVRLVFRPYTQLRRSICTSESLRSSIRVSPDFNLARHSSPSFGSQRACSGCSARYEVEAKRRGCADVLQPDHPSATARVAFAFTAPLGLDSPLTCTHARLLGPCFKTGRRQHRPTRDSAAGRDRQAVTLATNEPAQKAARSRPAGQVSKPPSASARTATNLSRPLGPVRAARPVNSQGNAAAGQERKSASRRPCGSHERATRCLTRPVSKDCNFEVASVYLHTVSRTLELSLQSSFQLSLTVLVCYRSRGDI